MNFYKHHLGDYAKDTSHLSWLEDMAYTRALRVYYLRERPLPLDMAECFRLVRAVTRREKEAVTRVLAEFFVQQDDGWHNKRGDQEIRQYQAQASTNRRIALERTVQRSVNESSTKRIPSHKPEPIAINQIKEDLVGIAPKNGARHAIQDDSPVVQTLPLRDGSDFEVRKSFVAELEPLYPAVDVPATVNEMKGWLIGKPERRKTRRGVKAFITKWLHNEQEKLSGG